MTQVMLYRLQKRIQGLLAWPFFRLYLAASDYRCLDGIPVYIGPTETTEGSSNEIFRQIQEGLAILRRYDAQWFDRVQRDLACVIVRPCRRPHYAHLVRSCVLDRVLVLKQPPGEIALTLVHEAAHARIERMGIPWTDATLKYRIERLCTKAEFGFLLKLPTDQYPVSAGVLEDIKAFITTGEPSPKWEAKWRVYDQSRGYEPLEP